MGVRLHHAQACAGEHADTVDDVLPHGFGGTAYGHRVFPTSSQDSPAPLYRSRSDTRVDLLAGIHLPAQRT